MKKPQPALGPAADSHQGADRHLDLFLVADNDEYKAARDVKITVAEGILGGQRSKERAKQMGNASGCGRLALHTDFALWQFRLKRRKKDWNGVIDAFRNAIHNDPRSIGHRYRLARFLRAQNRPTEAAAEILAIQSRAPKAKFLQALTETAAPQ